MFTSVLTKSFGDTLSTAKMQTLKDSRIDMKGELRPTRSADFHGLISVHFITDNSATDY